MARIEIGTVVAGKYRIESLIGRGGMGSVWRAEHLDWGAPVAVKILEFEGAGGAAGSPDESGVPAALVQRFGAEARTAAAIRSPHVVQILDHGVDDVVGAPYIAMELLEGESLASRLARVGRLSALETARVVTHVARALTRLHDAGMVHRDLKPANVFIVRNDDEEVAKVLDFGIAKHRPGSLNEGVLTTTGQQLGTPYYMSPAQIRGQRGVDYRADLWALGVVAFECLTGRRPFEGETLGDLSLKICAEPLPVPSSLVDVSPGVDAWFLRSVSRDPSQTFGSAREAAEALRALLLAGHGSHRRLAPAAALEPPASGSIPAVSEIEPLASSFLPTRVKLMGASGLVVALFVGLWLWARAGRVAQGQDQDASVTLHAPHSAAQATAATAGRAQATAATAAGSAPPLGQGGAPAELISAGPGAAGASGRVLAAPGPAGGASASGTSASSLKAKPSPRKRSSRQPRVQPPSKPRPAAPRPSAGQPPPQPPLEPPRPSDLIEDRL